MKTEKEKMLAGEYYDAADKELITRWHLSKKLMKEYYLADTTNKELLDSILDQLIGSRGENVWISAPIYVDYGENIHIGNDCEINMNCTFLDCNKITIGDHTGIGPNVQIFAVWIGGGAIIFAGVTIGDNTTIGAGSVVTRDIPANCLAVGNPAKVIKYFD